MRRNPTQSNQRASVSTQSIEVTTENPSKNPSKNPSEKRSHLVSIKAPKEKETKTKSNPIQSNQTQMNLDDKINSRKTKRTRGESLCETIQTGISILERWQTARRPSTPTFYHESAPRASEIVTTTGTTFVYSSNQFVLRERKRDTSR